MTVLNRIVLEGSVSVPGAVAFGGMGSAMVEKWRVLGGPVVAMTRIGNLIDVRGASTNQCGMVMVRWDDF